MEIEPIKIFWMILASLVFGLSAGAVNDMSRAVRTLFGVSYGESRSKKLEELKLPIIKRSLGAVSCGKIKKRCLPSMMFFQDVFLFAYAGVGVAVLDYYFNSGRPRIYTPIAVVIGFLLYYFTIGKISPFVFCVLTFVFRAVLAVFFEAFCRPLRYFVKYFGNFVKKIYTNINKTIAKKQKKVYNSNKEKKVMEEAASGYLGITKR